MVMEVEENSRTAGTQTGSQICRNVIDIDNVNVNDDNCSSVIRSNRNSARENTVESRPRPRCRPAFTGSHDPVWLSHNPVPSVLPTHCKSKQSKQQSTQTSEFECCGEVQVNQTLPLQVPTGGVANTSNNMMVQTIPNDLDEQTQYSVQSSSVSTVVQSQTDASALTTMTPTLTQPQIIQVMAPSEDVHICGTCKAQLNSIELFIQHKQQGCQILRPAMTVNQPDIILRPPMTQPEVLLRPPVNQQQIILRPPVSHPEVIIRAPLNQQEIVPEPQVVSQPEVALRPPFNQQEVVLRPPVSQPDVLRPPVNPQEDIFRLPVSQSVVVLRPPSTSQTGVFLRPPSISQPEVILRPPVNQQEVVLRPPTSQMEKVLRPPTDEQGAVTIEQPVQQRDVVLGPAVVNQQPPLVSNEVSMPIPMSVASSVTTAQRAASPQVSLANVQHEATTDGLSAGGVSMDDLLPGEAMEGVDEFVERNQAAKSVSGKKVKKYTCHYNDCKFQTAYLNDLERHWRIHTGEKPFHCGDCGKSFSRHDHLRLHMYEHGLEKPFKCQQCNYSTAERSALKKHIRIHTGERPFKCQLCPYASRNSSQLTVHLRSHTGDSPFQCHICPSKFKINSDLKRHLRTHTGEKPFKCSVCDYRCALKGNLQIHYKLNHSDEQQYDCGENDCDFQTSSKKMLREHKKVHKLDNMFQCLECHYICTSKGSLKMHMETHSQEKRFKCDFCSHSCRQRGNMRVHLMRKHPEEMSVRKMKNGESPKKLTHRGHVMCKTVYNCMICGDGFVREDSYKSHVKQHKELALVMEDTALAVLQLQTPVTNIQRGVGTASGGKTQEATVSSSSEADGRAEESGEGQGRCQLEVGAVSAPPVVGGGNVRTVIVQTHNGQQVMVPVGETQTAMVPGSSLQSVVTGGDGSQMVAVSGNFVQSNETSHGPGPRNQSQVATLTQVPSVHSAPTTNVVMSVTKASQQTSTTGVTPSGQNQHLVQKTVIDSNAVSSKHVPHPSVSKFTHQGRVVEMRAPKSNPAVTITHTPLKKVKKQTIHSLLNSSAQPPVAIGNTQQTTTAPVSNPHLVNQLQQTVVPQVGTLETVNPRISPVESSQGQGTTDSGQTVPLNKGTQVNVVSGDENSRQIAAGDADERRMVVEVPLGGTAQFVNVSSQPMVIQPPMSNEYRRAGPTVNQTQGSASPVPPVVQASSSGIHPQVVIHVPPGVENQPIPVQVSSQQQTMLHVPPGGQPGVCYRLVQQVSGADGSVTFSLVPESYLPEQSCQGVFKGQ